MAANHNSHLLVQQHHRMRATALLSADGRNRPAAATRAVPMERVLIDPVLWDLRERELRIIEAELGCRRERTTMDFVSSSATESARTTEKSAPGMP
jgi:hypothetical protein